MQTDFLPLDLYAAYLKTIHGVNFTRREIEVMAFLVSGRGVKAIASSLSIAPKTVEAHIHNIMLKVECNSRESIISFIEKSDKLSFIRRHYSNLLTTFSFDQSLTEIAKLQGGAPLNCLIISWEEHGKTPPLIYHIETHLKKAGFEVFLEHRKNPQPLYQLISESHPNERVIYYLPQDILPSTEKLPPCPKNALFLLPESLSLRASANFINLAEQKNTYFMALEVIQKLLPSLDLSLIIVNFKRRYDLSQDANLSANFRPQNTHETKKLENEHRVNASSAMNLKWRTWGIIGLFCVGIFSIGNFFLKERSELLQSPLVRDQSHPQEILPIRSDLIIPTTSALLNRSELIDQIDNKFKRLESIQTVAIVGIGGSGKTTLARQYAQQQKTNIVWEINAETKETLNTSFENLGIVLSKRDKDKQALKDIQEIKDACKREEALIQFVKAHLRATTNWFLIFDNVEKFTDIQHYFPQDPNTWGHGKIILTTRDSNIENNNHVNQVVFIGELNPEQKLNLFTKIMDHGASKLFTTAQIEEARKFLENIPPFPLDISTAAYYLKMTQIPYQGYLENLRTYDQDFANVQENLLKEAGPYTKTRYGIISLSLEHLIKNHKDFRGLLFFISLLDSQNIPRDLLNVYTSNSIVDNFIYHLKKYSLITNEPSTSFILPTLSLHRSTQAIILVYLTKTLNEAENRNLVNSITQALENYVEDALEKEELSKLKPLIPHLEAFLNHNHLLTNSVKGVIESELGYIYSSFSLFIQANHFFDKALLNFRKDDNQNYEKMARNLLFQGNGYNILGDYKKAENILVEGIDVYKTHLPMNKKKLALGLMYLGNVYRWTGKYEKAKHFLQESLAIYVTLPPQGNVGHVMTQAYLGDIYRRTGDYKKAIDISEKSLAFCNKYLPQGNVRLAWPFVMLGTIHKDLGDYEKSLDFINTSISIYEKNFSKTSIFVAANLIELAKAYCNLGNYSKAINLAENTILIYQKLNISPDVCRTDSLGCMGNAYKGLGNYEKAKAYLEENLNFFEKHYGKDHIETAAVLQSLGEVYLLEGNLKVGEQFLDRALNILQTNKHPNAYKCLESFSDVHLKKSEEATHKQAMKEAQSFQAQAINDLKKALEIIKTHFPEDSPHRERIQEKLKKIPNLSQPNL